ncbi:TPR repeat-containing protein [Acidovorax sp. CF316]|uniref:tetratricopeptide repeat protein n=1 Tax=Acidovorax sp. CF316 TaxID=1144317 RepID=UPI00026BCB4E|nr:SEL1-like repeat protein [Acidovorax sp. CF316]EJE52232.1 TPR repeat-containing protein [Acidovorax sp. CF316]
MSYTLQLWEKPVDWPWPTTKKEADAQFERVSDSAPPGQNPKFLEWGRVLQERYPEAMDVWLDGSEDGVTEDATLGFGINTRTEHWDAAFNLAWEQATLRGLSLYDPQSGVHYLGNGDVPEEPDLQVRFAVQARERGDEASAWTEYRRWAARGNPHALYAMGRALRFGTMGQRRHFDLAAALQVMGAHDAPTRQDAQAFYERFPIEAKGRIQTLMARLKSASGDMLLTIVDGERKALDDAFTHNEQMMLYTRKRIEAADALEAIALQGHEVAAFQYALEVVIGWEEPNYENARYWCQRAVDWDHEPAKRLFALMHERGWGGPVDMALAAKWNAAAKDQWQQEQKLRQAREEAESPGGLSLAPMAPSAPAMAPVVWTGSVTRDLVGWFAREGNPHAAFHLGTSDQYGRDGGLVNLAQARDWYAQAAEAGHADATYNLGVFIEDGTGGPRDAQVAKALFMLANTRGTTRRVDDLKIAPHEQGPVRALVAALREPGRLRAVLREKGLGAGASPAVAGMGGSAGTAVAGGAAAALSASDWGRTGGAPAAPATAAPQGPAPARSRGRIDDREAEDDPADDPRYRNTTFSLHLGHLALVIGAANVVLLILFFKEGASFRRGMAVMGLIAAFGAWRTGRDFDWAPAARAAVAVVAAIPIVGMAVSVWMLVRAFRGRV